MTLLLRLSGIAFAVSICGVPLTAGPASAGTRLYTGSVQIVLAYSPSTAYSIPFGSAFSYPKMSNAPGGDLATVTGSGPGAIALGPNQMALHTTISSTSPPTSWGVTEIATTFSGGHAAGNFFGNGAPGAASSGPLGGSGPPASQFGVTFKGTPERFGGTMALLGSHRVRWNALSISSYPYRCPACTILTRPLTPIGGAFGGVASGGTWVNGTGAAPTFFDVTVWGFPWTTGSVTARAPAPLTPSLVHSVTAMGTDQRTLNGEGNIQLVSPFVVRYTVDRWNEPLKIVYQPGVAIANLHFVPEPAALLLLASGVVGLVGLGVLSKRSSSSGE